MYGAFVCLICTSLSKPFQFFQRVTDFLSNIRKLEIKKLKWF